MGKWSEREMGWKWDGKGMNGRNGKGGMEGIERNE